MKLATLLPKLEDPNMEDPIVNHLDVERTAAPMILVLGQTGAGKSYFCNKVLGEDVRKVKESAHLESCMRNCPKTISLTFYAGVR